MRQPPDPRDYRAVVAAAVGSGSVLYPADALPCGVVEWRSGIRRAAKARGTRISVRTVAGLVCVLDPDYEVTDIEMSAAATLMESYLNGGRQESWEKVLDDQRRRAIRIADEPAP